MPAPAAGNIGRREARDRAVQLTYEREQRGLGADDLIAEQVLAPDAYTSTLLAGVERHMDQIDGLITRFSTGWPLQRMPALDRAVLRVAVYELGHEPEIPAAVILNEAVEFANTYSTDDSGKFVNGLLSAVSQELRPS
jgi:N utilization substance protein B